MRACNIGPLIPIANSSGTPVDVRSMTIELFADDEMPTRYPQPTIYTT